jgi:hypothetical protein
MSTNELAAREQAKYRGITPAEAARRMAASTGRRVGPQQILRLGGAGKFKVRDVGLPGAARRTWAVHEESFTAWLRDWSDASTEGAAA